MTPRRRQTSVVTPSAATPQVVPSLPSRRISAPVIAFYTFDLSLDYNTMDMPANEYLRNIRIQLVVRRSPFEYRISTGGGNPLPMDILENNQGRIISLNRDTAMMRVDRLAAVSK